MPGCIGCAACPAVSDNWEMKEIDGEEKADFKKQDVEESEFEENMEAAESCPVEVIHIVDNETGKRVI